MSPKDTKDKPAPKEQEPKEQTNALDNIETPTPAPKKPEPVTLRSPHDYAITSTALALRIEELKKLSKKNSEEGYHREARAVQADADAIEHFILPQFRSQREIPFVSVEELEKEVAGAIRVFVSRAFNGLDDPKQRVMPEGVHDRRDRLVKTIAERVALYVSDVARESFDHGYAFRETSPQALAVRHIATLRANA